MRATEDEAEGAMPPGMAALWRPDDRPRRGPRPGLTLEGIAAAAIELADRDGLPAVSMARVADRVGVTTMALYRYVGSKEELLAVMYDAALPFPGTPARPDEPWRDQLEQWCRDQLALVAQHPWVVELSGSPPIGPQRVAWIDRGLVALRGTGLPEGPKVAIIGMLSLHLLTEGQLIAAAQQQRRAQAAARTGTARTGRAAPDVAGHPALLDYGTLLRLVVDPAEHPTLALALEAGAFDDDQDADDEGGTDNALLDLALTVLLDGIEVLVDRVRTADRDAP